MFFEICDNTEKILCERHVSVNAFFHYIATESLRVMKNFLRFILL